MWPPMCGKITWHFGQKEIKKIFHRGAGWETHRENLCENMDYTFFAEKYFKQLMWFALPVALLEPALIKNTNYEVGRKMQPINQDDV